MLLKCEDLFLILSFLTLSFSFFLSLSLSVKKSQHHFSILTSAFFSFSFIFPVHLHRKQKLMAIFMNYQCSTRSLHFHPFRTQHFDNIAYKPQFAPNCKLSHCFDNKFDLNNNHISAYSI